MLKVVVFDCGYGGEIFADKLEAELPILDVIRVIDWRHAEDLSNNPKRARELMKLALRPYVNKVDLIIFANYYLTITNLKYFQHKYKKQKFLGLNLKAPDTFIKHDVLILSTNPVSKNLHFRHFLSRIHRRTKILNLDSWPSKIDDGELTAPEINQTLKTFLFKYKNFQPKEIVLASAQFSDIEFELKKLFGQSLKIYDGFNETIRNVYKTLNLRGGPKKRK